MTTIVLFGGRSDERHVSVASAQNIARTLESPLCWFWTADGAVHDVAVSELLAHQNPFVADFVPSRPAIWPDLEQALDTLPVDDPVFLLALHGGEGEDGTVQGWMERRGIAFTGSGSVASAAAFDKGHARDMVNVQVLVAAARVLMDLSLLDQAMSEMIARHGKIVLKPLAAGSSRGLFFVDGSSDLADVSAKIRALNIPYIAEQFITGREMTVGIIERAGKTIALPVIEIEIDAGHAFDYEGKYLGKGTREICPAAIPDSLRDEAQRTARAAHLALGCQGYSRSDLIAAEDGVYFLETNTLPGMTTSSLVPQELREAGIGFRDFLEEQLALAVSRHKPAVAVSGLTQAR